jgi:Lon protease-like protein
MNVPLFPLRTVLYPGGPLPLRIFEQRYLDLISRCLKQDEPFGVVLIRSGSEVGPAEIHATGTLARITDWYQGSDGILGVTATGEDRFRVVEEHREADGLLVGEVELLPAEPESAMPERYRPLAQILAGVLDDLGRLYEDLEKRYDDASWVSYRFAEILPISAEQKQAFLEMTDPMARLEAIRAVLESG